MSAPRRRLCPACLQTDTAERVAQRRRTCDREKNVRRMLRPLMRESTGDGGLAQESIVVTVALTRGRVLLSPDFGEPRICRVDFLRVPEVRSSSRRGQELRCSFENIEAGKESVKFEYATQVHETRALCPMGVCAVRRGLLRRPHLLSVGARRRVRRHPSLGSHAVLESAGADHITKHSRSAAMTGVRNDGECGLPRVADTADARDK